MPLNGSGTYAAPSYPGSWNPAQTGSTADPNDWNGLLTDLSTALSTMICKDGQTTVTADIPMASHKFTGLAAGTGNGHSVRYEQVFSSTTAVGAANKTISSSDLAGIFTLDNSAAGRSVTLPALASVGTGFSFRFMGLSNATLLSLVPNGSDAIDFSTGGTTVKLPGKVRIDVWSDGSQWRTSYPYNTKTKILEYSPSAGASVDTGGSALPSWINDLRIEWDLTPATNNVSLSLQLYDSTGTLKSGGSDYYYIDLNANTSASSSVQTATASSMLLAQTISNSATQNTQGYIECHALQAANARAAFMGLSHWLDQAGTVAAQAELGGRANFGNAITGFKMFMSSGNETGSVRVYANG